MLAINGGNPIREKMLQYGKQTLDQSDKDAIMKVLDSNTYLTTGPWVAEFERKAREFCGATYALAVNSGTAALHCAMVSLDLQSTDEVIVTGLSFVASANCIVYCGATPIFCDIEEDTMNIDPTKIETLITERTKAIIAVDFAGQLCNYTELHKLAQKYSLKIIADAAHSFGISLDEKYVGTFADITTTSFHPVKNMTTCEGGMIFTDNEELFNKMKAFRQHGISRDYKEREKTCSHYYEMTSLGYNYRIPDVLCALGTNQLQKLPVWIKRRNEIAQAYDAAFTKLNSSLERKVVVPLTQKYPTAYHIYVIQLEGLDRDTIFRALKAEGIGTNVHYLPIYLHPYYKKNYQTKEGMLPVAEKVYEKIITLPLFPTLSEQDINDVIAAVDKVVRYYINCL